MRLPEADFLDGALRAFVSDWPTHGRSIAIILAVFVAGALLYRVASGGLRGNGTGLLRWIFPRELYRHGTARADKLTFGIFYVLWIPPMRVVMTVFLTVLSAGTVHAALSHWLGTATPALTGAPLVAFQVAVLFLCAEFSAYWMHRFLHTVPLLWAFHRVHHSAEALTVFTRTRFHPVDLVLLAFGKLVPAGALAGAVFWLAATPPDAGAMLLYLAAGALMPYGLDVWRHTHVRLSLGPLNRLINAPVMHQIHHSAEARHKDKNLGGELTLFDWLFGTLYLPESDEEFRWGLNEAERGPDNPHLHLKDFYLEPFRYAAGRLRGAAPRIRSARRVPTVPLG